MASAVAFRIASEDWEFEQIHRLNYQTFVEEIPQHRPNADGMLVDAFHEENTYLIAVRDRRLVGMMALRGRRPFSLDRKVPDVDRFLPPARRPCEIRLLATTLDARNGVVFRGLVQLLTRHAIEQGFDLAVISGTVRQTKLYLHLGFVPFGSLIGQSDALYQPMYLTLEAFRKKHRIFIPPVRRSPMREPHNFLPGPVDVHPDVATAFHGPPASSRSPSFVHDFQASRRDLCRMVNARHVQILMGSGTLANDAIAAELSLTARKGLILSNGAFGERLIDHARRFGLSFRALERPWGQPLESEVIAKALDADPAIQWMWGVHGETSTGMLNDLDEWKSLCTPRGIQLCVDAISSFANAPVDLQGVALASGVSGKGLGAFPGLAFVFHEAPIRHASASLPRYLDLGFYAEHDGIPFTLSSNLLQAVRAAVRRFDGEARFARVRGLSTQLRHGLRALGLQPVVSEAVFSAVTSVALTRDHDSAIVGQRLADDGFLLHYRTPPLLQRNWLQVCMMGEQATPESVDALIAALRRVLGGSHAPG
jgi:aspartate aminotransferase-like enzyme